MPPANFTPVLLPQFPEHDPVAGTVLHFAWKSLQQSPAATHLVSQKQPAVADVVPHLLAQEPAVATHAAW